MTFYLLFDSISGRRLGDDLSTWPTFEAAQTEAREYNIAGDVDVVEVTPRGAFVVGDAAGLFEQKVKVA